MILIFVHVFQTLKKEENNSQVGVVFKESLLTETGVVRSRYETAYQN